VQVEDTEHVPTSADGQRRVRVLARATEGQDIRNVVSSIAPLLEFVAVLCIHAAALAASEDSA
jgi:hypothetical protein